MKSLSDLLAPKPAGAATRRHRIEWFLDDGEITFELECLDAPLEESQQCDCYTAREDRAAFLMGYDGDRTPLVDGVIVSHWKGMNLGEYDDWEMVWTYAD